MKTLKDTVELKKLNCNNISLKDFLDTLSKTEFKYMKMNSEYREDL